MLLVSPPEPQVERPYLLLLHLLLLHLLWLHLLWLHLLWLHLLWLYLLWLLSSPPQPPQHSAIDTWRWETPVHLPLFASLVARAQLVLMSETWPMGTWPASAAQGADWPKLAEAQGSLRRGLTPKEAPGESAGRRLSQLVSDTGACSRNASAWHTSTSIVTGRHSNLGCAPPILFCRSADPVLAPCSIRLQHDCVESTAATRRHPRRRRRRRAAFGVAVGRAGGMDPWIAARRHEH